MAPGGLGRGDGGGQQLGVEQRGLAEAVGSGVGVQHGLRAAQGRRGAAQQWLDPAVDGGVELLLRNDLVQDGQFRGPVGVEPVGREQQLPNPGGTRLVQHPGGDPAPGRGNAEAQLRDPVVAGVRSDAQVAEDRESQSRPYDAAVQPCDGDDSGVRQQVAHPARLVGERTHARVAGLRREQGGEFGAVPAEAEVAARAGEDQDTGGGMVVQRA